MIAGHLTEVRMFQTERTINANPPRQAYAWHVEGTAKRELAEGRRAQQRGGQKMGYGSTTSDLTGSLAFSSRGPAAVF